jgi:hypothetical protein
MNLAIVERRTITWACTAGRRLVEDDLEGEVAARHAVALRVQPLDDELARPAVPVTA